MNAKSGVKEIFGWFIDGFTVAFAAWILYMLWKHPAWDFLLTLACVAAPVLIVIGIVSHLRAARWGRMSR